MGSVADRHYRGELGSSLPVFLHDLFLSLSLVVVVSLSPSLSTRLVTESIYLYLGKLELAKFIRRGRGRYFRPGAYRRSSLAGLGGRAL